MDIAEGLGERGRDNGGERDGTWDGQRGLLSVQKLPEKAERRPGRDRCDVVHGDAVDEKRQQAAEFLEQLELPEGIVDIIHGLELVLDILSHLLFVAIAYCFHVERLGPEFSTPEVLSLDIRMHLEGILSFSTGFFRSIFFFVLRN